MADDLDPLNFPPFDWTKPAGSLDALFGNVKTKATEAIGWYWKGIREKRRCAWGFRGLAILLGALATAAPTIAEMTSDASSYKFSALWSTLFGIAAAALLLLDRLMGASNGWVRYIKAELQLRAVLEKLNLAYIMEKGNWAAGVPTQDQARKALDVLSAFISQINEVITSETNQWATEFQSAIQSIDDYVKAAPRSVTLGGLTVTMDCDLPLSGDWTLYLDDKREATGRGQTWAKTLIPAIYQVRVEAQTEKTVDGAVVRTPVQAQSVVTVAAGAPATLSLKLI